MKRVLVVFLLSGSLAAQVQKLTLEEARELALKNHPNIQAVDYSAQAAAELSKQIRSALAPQLTAGFTASAADDGSRLAIAGIATSLLFSRVGAGLQLSQLVSDSGRTKLLAQSAGTRADAQREQVKTSRLQVLAAVDRSYYGLLRARSIVRVAQQTVKARQLIVDQVSALAESKLRSIIDVSFAKVNLSDAQILLSRAQNEVDSSEADLTLALGSGTRQQFLIDDRPLNERIPPEAEDLVNKALAERPEIRQALLETQSAEQLLEAEKRLNRPIVSVIGSAGTLPWAQGNYPAHYGALGLNVSIPILNGHLFEARQSEVSLRMRSLEKQRQEQANQIARDVRVAYLNARNAFERLSLTRELVTQANLSLDLAQSRYDLGLGSIVELSQAQLSQTAAEVASASARYEYQILRSVLRFQIGEGIL